MSIECLVELYPDLTSSERSLPETLCEQVPFVPDGFVLSGGRRKFIVLEHADELVVAIGPLMDGNMYLHVDILKRAQPNYPNFHISGGGWVEFQTPYFDYRDGNPWLVTFKEKSGDFGNFDPRLLLPEVTEQIRRGLGCGAVQFEWKGAMRNRR